LAHLALPAILAALAMLQALAPMVPSESVGQGGGIELALGWLAVATAGAFWLGTNRRPVRWNAPDTAILVLFVWTLLSAQFMAWEGNPRATWNTAWQWIALLAGFWIMRQLLYPPAVARAMLAVVAAIAVALAVHGVYQFSFGLPAQREQYYGAEEAERQRILRENGVDPAPDSPQRRQFESRLDSTEPYATFGLTNSLAGFLVPWTLVLLALGLLPHKVSGLDRWRRAIWCLALLALLVCLLLTKSRSAWLALLLGGGWLIGARAWHHRERIGSWGWVVGLGLLLAVTVGLASGALDREVFTEAGLSLRYRWEYWQVAAAMAWEHPWFGCGPGNFQEYYTRYKPPQASETVADPHNLLAETAATIGLVGGFALVSFLALTGFHLLGRRPTDGAPATDVASPPTQGDEGPAPRKNHAPSPAKLRASAGSQPGAPTSTRPSVGGDGPPNDPTVGSSVAAIYLGAIMGVFGSVPLGLLIGFPPEFLRGTPLPVSWIVGLPTAGIVLWMLHPWVERGTLSPRLIAVAAGSLVVNLLAAGGIVFPGVSQSLWLLAAAGLNAAGPSQSAPEALRQVGSGQSPSGWENRAAWGLAILLTSGLTFAMYIHDYRPVTQARMLLQRAPESRNYEQLEGWYAQAAVADPLDPIPWQLLAELSQLRWLEVNDPKYRDQFEQCVREAQRRNSRSSSLANYLGRLYLRGYRSAASDNDLERALDAFRRAIQLYPNHNMGHAQFAWIAHLAGKTDQARRHAELALQLDALNPHWEQQLAQRSLHDPGPGEDVHGQAPAPPHGQSAEQVMQWLRNGSEEMASDPPVRQ
jgi:hypothetical protein